MRKGETPNPQGSELPRTEGSGGRKTGCGGGAGHRLQRDLHSLAPFLQEAKPVLIGVDGGADALLAFGYKPHLIVGIWTASVMVLTCGAQLIATLTKTGNAPVRRALKRWG